MRKKLILLFFLMLFVTQILPLHKVETLATDERILDVMETVNASTYGIGLWGFSWAHLTALLGKTTADSVSYEEISGAIESYLIPLNVRFIYGLDDAWKRANTTPTKIPRLPWMDDLLTAFDKYGIAVTFRGGPSGYGSQWATDVLGWKPETQTYDKDGVLVSEKYIMIDHPWVTEQLKLDLKQLYTYYGRHSSWIGFGLTALTDHDRYSGDETFAETFGKKNNGYCYGGATLSNYTKSHFYTVNGLGYHTQDGTKCKLYEMFIEETATYQTAELSADIASYHMDSDQAKNNFRFYLFSQHMYAYNEARKWFESYTGKTWFLTMPYKMNQPAPYFTSFDLERNFYVDYALGSAYYPPDTEATYLRDGMAYTILRAGQAGHPLDIMPWSSLGNPGDNLGGITMEQIGKYYLAVIPIVPTVWLFDWTPGPAWGGRTDFQAHIKNLTHQTYSRAFGEILGRMLSVGTWYGTENEAASVLYVARYPTNILVNMLSTAVKVTWSDARTDSNLTYYGDLSQFDVILWNDLPQYASANLQSRIETFVQNGGGFVYVGGSWSPTFDNILGTDEGPSIPTTHPIWKPYTDADFEIARPHICESPYGAGRGVHIQFGSYDLLGDDTQQWVGYTSSSAFNVLINALLYAAKNEDKLPAWWYDKYNKRLPWYGKRLYYSINGKLGKPLLLWLTNNDIAEAPFEIHLNSDFYNIDKNGWMAIDVQNWEVVSSGTGTDIKINCTIPPKTWKPIYLVNATSELHELYSNVFVKSRSQTSTGATFVLQGSYNQSGWLMVRSSGQLLSVSSNITDVLPNYPLDTLNTSSKLQGWYYDSTNKILYIKIPTKSAVQISVEVNLPPTNEALTLVNPSIGTQGILAAKQPYTFEVNVSDLNGVANLNYVDLTLDPEGQALRVRWSESTDSFGEVNDPNDYIELGSSSKSTFGNHVTLNFSIVFHWNYPDENPHSVRVESIDNGGLSDTDDFPTAYFVENDVMVYSATVDDDHVNPGQTITFSGYVFYEGTTIPPRSGHAITIELGTLEKGTTTTDEKGYYSNNVSAESEIAKHTYAINSIHSTSKKTVDVIVDRIKIVEGGVSDDRCDSGSTQTVWYKAIYEYDGKVFASNATAQVLKLNGTEMIWQNGRWEQTYESDEVAKKVFHITSVNDGLHGLTVINNMAGDEEIIWDKLKVLISANEYEVIEGTTVDFTITITREYDSTNVTSFSIKIRRNGTSVLTLTDKEFHDYLLTVGDFVYTTGSVTDNIFGLSIFETNYVTISWVRQKNAFSPLQFILPALQYIHILTLILLDTLLIVIGFFIIRRWFSKKRKT